MSLCDPPPGTQRAELVLSGLSCPACVRTVEEALRGVPGVESASLNLATAHALVDYDPSRTSLVAIHDAIKKAGYRVGVGRARFRIKGMTCASCVTRIEGALKATPGVIRGTVSVGTEEAEVEYDLGATNLHTVVPIQRIVDVVSGYFTPSVAILAILGFMVWYTFGPEPRVVYGLIVAVTTLIIACPCALGMATPMSLTTGVGLGALNGILSRGGDALQSAEKLQTVIGNANHLKRWRPS